VLTGRVLASTMTDRGGAGKLLASRCAADGTALGELLGAELWPTLGSEKSWEQ
jgi:hypothetical protein